MDCENLQNCPFYNDKMPIDSAVGTMYKKRYCEGDKLKCARYMVCTSVGKEYVENNLYPNMRDKAEQIINDVKKGVSK